MVRDKLTNFHTYNVYRCNNSGIFACIDYFTVGRDAYPEEYKLENFADCLAYAKKLNKRSKGKH